MKRDGGDVAGVEKIILSLNPLEPPTRQAKRSPKMLFRYASMEEHDNLMDDFMALMAQYRVASEAFCRGNLKAAGSNREAARRVQKGTVAEANLTTDTTRRIKVLDTGDIGRVEVPAVEVPLAIEVRSPGQPP